MDNVRKPFFIHIPKNMGSFMIAHYFSGPEYERFNGIYNNISEYYDKYGTTLVGRKLEEIKREFSSRLSIDHLTIDELLQTGILTNQTVVQYNYIAIVRDPFERFISSCNYWVIHPKHLVYNIKQLHLQRQQNLVIYQHLRPQSDYLRIIRRITPNIQIFAMKEKEKIRDFMKSQKMPKKIDEVNFSRDSNFAQAKFINKEVDFDEKINVSATNKYNIQMLSRDEFLFLHQFYHEDIRLYNGLIIKKK